MRVDLTSRFDIRNLTKLRVASERIVIPIVAGQIDDDWLRSTADNNPGKRDRVGRIYLPMKQKWRDEYEITAVRYRFKFAVLSPAD